MADNFMLPQVWRELAADEIDGKMYLRVKLCAGADGTARDWTGGSKDDGPAWTSAYLQTASADARAGVDVTAAPASGQKLVIDDVIISTDTAMKVTLEEETSGTDVVVLFLPANGSAQVTPRGRIKLATADKKLRLVASAAGNVAVTVCYHAEA